ncbi:MAG TPA: hypothetical protein VH019_05720 [Rhizomicrobium sp.]|nr:hypothetical protein [Rhizomicrobium sp.]
MKPIAVVFVIALIPATVMTAHAKTVTATHGTADQKSVSGVAGPPPTAQNSGPSQDASQAGPSSTHPGKKALKKAKVVAPPPMHDPN